VTTGVQHIAVATNNIIETVGALKDRGVEFLYVPPSYYDTVMDRVGEIDEDLAVLKQHGVLVDRDDEGYLLQLFTKPVLDRPTMFFEIIQASVFVPHWREAPRASARATSRRCSRRSNGSRRTGEHFDPPSPPDGGFGGQRQENRATLCAILRSVKRIVPDGRTSRLTRKRQRRKPASPRTRHAPGRSQAASHTAYNGPSQLVGYHAW
jgi:biotin operon repressor